MKIGIITQYPKPDQDHDAKLSGVATFCKYLYSTAESDEHEFVIYANTDSEAYVHTNEYIQIAYIWKKGVNPFWTILKDMRKRKIDIIHIHHELYLFGSIWANFFFIIFLMHCKLIGVRTIVEFHSVVPLKKIDMNFMIENGMRARPRFARFCFRGLHFGINLSAYHYIVHEDIFKEYLVKYYNVKRNRITVLALPCINPPVTYDQEEAKKLLKIDQKSKMVLFFGFITGYKGLDRLCTASETFLNSIDNCVLYVAGGLHPRLKGNDKYLSYVDSLKDKLDASLSVWHGYAQDCEMPILFSAADVVIFPYTVAMSSSGPLAQAIAFEDALIVSDAFKDIIFCNECFFGSTPDDLSKKICEFFENEQLRDTIIKYAKELKVSRQPEVLWQKLCEIYNKL